MKRLAMLSILMLALLALLTGCYGDIDPCTFDKTVPACDLSRSKAQATIGAINDDAALRATQSAIYLAGQSTKSAISAEATRQVAGAEATHEALRMEATRQALRAAATQNAVVYEATQTSVDAEATKIALSVSGEIERSKTEREAMPANAFFNVLVFWFILPALVIVGLIVYGKRTVTAATEAIGQSIKKRAAIVRYGPPNNPQLALVVFDKDGNPTRITTTEGLIGISANLLTGADSVAALDVPPQMKLAALVESATRTQAARIAAATGQSPWGVQLTNEFYEETRPIETTPLAIDVMRVPTFAELLQAWKPSQSEMLLGLAADGSPRYCELEDLLSTGIVGKPKTGKSTVLRFIYLQCRMVGARVIVWDLHLTIVGTLPEAEAFTELDDINRSAAEVIDVLEYRRRNRQYNGQPIMILADEFNLLAPNSEIVTEAMGRIILEGRKYQIFSMISGQGLPAKLFGDSTPRDALSSRFVLHTTTRQADIIGLDREAKPWVVNLKRGQAIVDGPIDAQVLSIPNTTEADVKAFLTTSTATSTATSEPLPNWTVATSTEVVGSGGSGDLESDFATSERKRQVLDLLKCGKGKSEVIKIVYQTSGGNKFVTASKEVDRFIQESLK